ncbi:MAG: hypothetical protein QOC62_3868 [Mycobacterium sp.]|nr:hypothetical protein [Mycobacterium sp.]
MPARLPRGGGRQDPRRLTESIPGIMHTSVRVIGVLPDRLLSEVFDRGFCRWAGPTRMSGYARRSRCVFATCFEGAQSA